MSDDDDEIVQLVMGRIVDVGQWDQKRQAIFASALADVPADSVEGRAFRDMLQPFPGSVMKKCKICNVDIWIGPRQQAVIEMEPAAILACAVCTPMIAAEQDDPEISIANLGNDWKPKD